MRIRTVKPEFWHHEEMSEVSAEAALLALALLNYADDHGFFKWHPKLIESTLFPLRELSGSVPGMLRELSEIGYIKRLEGSDGKQYGQISTFGTHQKVSKPTLSKIEPLIIGESKDCEDSGRPPGGFREDSGRPPSGKGKEQGKEGKGKEPPIVPPWGTGEWDTVFPKGSLSKPVRDQRKTRVLANNPKMVHIGKWFSRKPDTLWTVAEAKALRDLDPSREEVETMGAYRETDNPYHRRDLLTLLNNWTTELDRARATDDSPPRPTVANFADERALAAEQRSSL